MKKINRIRSILATAVFFSAAPAFAMTITADYSLLGTVYQNERGVLSNTNGTDVTDIFKSNVQTSINYWQNAILLNTWNMTINFKLDTLSTSIAGISHIDSFDSNTRPLMTTISVGNSATPFYIDPTPADNSEFKLVDFSILAGTDTVNSGRFGAAVDTSASGRYDLLSLILHEMEHALGFDASNADNTRYTSAIDKTRKILTVPTLVSGLGSPFDIPVTGTHIDGAASGRIFNNTSLALPGFNSGERALLSGVDILAICTIEGCDASQVNTNPSAVLQPVNTSPSAVPEPDTLLLMSVAGLGMMGMVRRRRQLRA